MNLIEWLGLYYGIMIEERLITSGLGLGRVVFRGEVVKFLGEVGLV